MATSTPHPDRAGAVIFNSGGQVLLVRSSDGSSWVFPKGKVEKGERFNETAKREIREECGIDCSILSPLDTVTYEQEWFDPDDPKKTWKTQISTLFFTGKAIRKVGEGDHEIVWLDPHSAYHLLTFADHQSLLAKALCWE